MEERLKPLQNGESVSEKRSSSITQFDGELSEQGEVVRLDKGRVGGRNSFETGPDIIEIKDE